MSLKREALHEAKAQIEKHFSSNPDVYCGGTQSGYHMFEFFSSGECVYGVCNRCLKQVSLVLGKTA